MVAFQSVLRLLVRFMVNLRFAVALLSTIAIVSIVATFLGEEAQAQVFRSAPFTALMGVFALSLVISVASRYPWKKTHAGWIMTHAGLIVIVCGHLTTCHHGQEGRVDLFEGQATNVMEQKEWALTADLPALGTRVSVKLPLDLPPDVPLEDRTYALPGGDRLIVDRFWPTFDVRTDVMPDRSSAEITNPAIQVELASGRQKVREWLLADDPIENVKSFGPHLSVLYRRLPDAAALDAALRNEGARPAEGRIVAATGDEIAAEVPLEAALAGPAPIGKSGFGIHIQRRFERLRIVDKEPREAESGPRNPALLVEISDGAGKKETRWLFAAHGELAAERVLELPFELRYVPSGEASSSSSPPGSVVVLEAPGREPVLIVTGPDGARLSAGPLALKKVFPLPWISAEGAIVERYPRAVVSQVPWCASMTANRPAVHVVVKPAEGVGAGSPEWVVWDSRDRPTTLEGSHGPIALRYGPRKVSLPFTIRLKDFVLQTYEGTDNPKSFESFVTVIPHDGKPPFDYHIYMNHPLTYAGYTFFQSSYDPETLRRSIFQVSYDPGWPVVYAGYALTIMGFLFIVYLKPVLIRREAARRAAEGLARVAAKKSGQDQAPAGEVPS